MPQDTILLSEICREAGISDATARRYFADFNPYRAAGGWHRFKPEEKADVLAFIESKRKRRCLNRFNAIPKTEGETQ